VQWQKNDYLISDDTQLIQLDVVHEFLSHSYWAKDIPKDIVSRSIQNSLCFGLFTAESATQASDPAVPKTQVGFARVVTDRATIAYLGDVFVLPEHRGQGLSKWLMDCLMAHPDLQGLRRWMLFTADAHGLYEKYGFTSSAKPDRYLEIARPGLYQKD